MTEVKGLFIQIQGIVQGVGFRPFVYSLASRYNLSGWVRNTTAGVEIEVDGKPENLSAFLEAIPEEAPPLAKINDIQAEDRPPNSYTGFEILHSQSSADGYQPISPDVSICDDCLEELFDPADHRYRYPFINCTNCGPRFTIIKDIPYDRPLTTMAPFEMCATCAAEYEDPLDRRFHAQPVACPECGPRVWLAKPARSPLDPAQAEITDDQALSAAQRMLAQGKILAIKGLGGFHLACDAENDRAVEKLRARKGRPAKPLAVMAPDLASASRFCRMNDKEQQLLRSPQRPILLLDEEAGSSLSSAIAPGQPTVGVMLPYTPLHYLLFSDGENFPQAPYTALVMTSGNLSDQPIITSNQEALERLDGIADAYLFHNRDIHVHCDDAVARVSRGGLYPIRRSRGYAPFPVQLPTGGPSILAAGPELKNTFCITKHDQAFLSQHIGDMQNLQTLDAFQEGVAHFERLFRVETQALAYDLHPNYLASRYALQRAEEDGLEAVGVQHHHAHIASCLADNGLEGQAPVIGVSFDGTGYGDDGHIWGGEILIADYLGYHRSFHLAYAPLPGGDRAIKEPWRIALGWLYTMEEAWDESLAPVQYGRRQGQDRPYDPLAVLRNQLQRGTNTPLTSSMGRLFDAVSALTGVCEKADYEAQAAIELEALADPAETGSYPFTVAEDIIDPRPMLQAVLDDLQDGVQAGIISARFHNGLSEMVIRACSQLREEHRLEEVALSGGVWQNQTLLQKTISGLQAAKFTVYTHHQVPANDGGISLGQAVIAQQHLIQEGETKHVLRRTRKDR